MRSSVATTNRAHARGAIVPACAYRCTDRNLNARKQKQHREPPKCEQLGTISSDPIGFSAGDSNLYRYVENQPTRFTDPSGLSPTRADTRDPQVILDYVRQLEQDNPNFSPAQILDLYQNNTCFSFVEQFPFGERIGIRDGRPTRPIPWHYVYTDSYGWIDMGHFLTMARLGRRYPTKTKVIESFGEAYEDYTEKVGKEDRTRPGFGSSANTPEDLISNRLGANFGAGLRNDVPLSQQLQEFFDRSGAQPKAKAWNYWFLPLHEGVWEQCWQRNPEKAMRKIEIIMDRDHPFWKKFPPDSLEVIQRTRNDEIWGPAAFPPSPTIPRRPPHPNE